MSALGIVAICVGGWLFSLLSVFIGMILWWLKNECWKGNTYTYFDFVDYCKETHIVTVDFFGEYMNQRQHKNFWSYNQFVFFSWFPGLNTIFALIWWVYWILYIGASLCEIIFTRVYDFWRKKFLKRLRFKA